MHKRTGESQHAYRLTPTTTVMAMAASLIMGLRESGARFSAIAERAEIHWGDETSLSTSDPRGRGFAPRGKTPVRTILSQRRSVRFLSTISNVGTLRFMVLTKAIDARTLITFFTRLCRDAGRKVFVILDNLSVHKTRDVSLQVEPPVEIRLR